MWYFDTIRFLLSVLNLHGLAALVTTRNCVKGLIGNLQQIVIVFNS